MKPSRYKDRDLSWLDFNERILQEAEDPRVSLADRMKFLAIYSSNLDEFYRVRVAGLRFAQRYNGDKKNKYGFRPSFVLGQIADVVDAQQERFGRIFHQQLLPEYAARGVRLVTPESLDDTATQAVCDWFEQHVGSLEWGWPGETGGFSLKNQVVYLYRTGDHPALVELDYRRWGRFIQIPTLGDRVLQLDDVVRIGCAQHGQAGDGLFAVKVSRDAELYLDQEDEADLLKRIAKSIRKRETGLPARLLFDPAMAYRDVDQLRKQLGLDVSALVSGGRYHNFNDFFGFPKPVDHKELEAETTPCQRLDATRDVYATLREKPVMLSFPYQSYDYLVDFIEHCCADPDALELRITLYRVASDSRICQALVKAAQVGKKVVVLDEVQARFDEQSNIQWGQALEAAGAEVHYGLQGLKVHAKLFSVKRLEAGQERGYAALCTGNFNEKTAKIYGDHALLTADQAVFEDLDRVFARLTGTANHIETTKLLVAPAGLRPGVLALIQAEVDAHRAGKPAWIKLKLNSLEDTDMIDALRQAAEAGVAISLVVRGICCYAPLTPKQAKHIQVVSVVDGFLEHARIYAFCSGGTPTVYLSSADWMTRNLSRRIEVAFPVEESDHQDLLLRELELQLGDTVKGRVVADNSRVQGEGTLSSQQGLAALVQSMES